MKISIKPIQFPELKEEIVIEIDSKKTINDLITEILSIKPILGSNFLFMFRGKKLANDKTLEDQGIKDGAKLMMQRSTEAKQEDITIEQQREAIKTVARTKLFEKGYELELIDSIIKTIPNVDMLTSEQIIEKSELFLIHLVKEEKTDFSIEVDSEAQNVIIDENKLTSIFSFGNGLQGQLGVGKFIKSDIPLRVNHLRNVRIKSISCGVSHTVALTENNSVYFWGRFFMPKAQPDATDYQIGDNPVPKLMESLTNEFIVKIGCGANHSLAINDKGEIFTWGEGVYGQLGHGILNNEYYPRKIQSLNFRFSQIIGGATHSIAVTDQGYIFGWGSNEKVQLNLKKLKHALSPVLLPLYELIGNYSIDEIKGMNLDSNFIEMKGVNALTMRKQNIQLHSDFDEIGISTNQSIETQNDISFNIEDLVKVKLIDCGTWFTVYTSQMFPSIIFIFGNNFKRVIKITYFEQNKLEIKQINASNYHICVLTDNGIYKINVDKLPNYKSGEEAEKLDYFDPNMEIEKIGCGYDYLLVLNKSNQVIYNAYFEKENIVLLNSELKTDVVDFATGPSHFFLISSLNRIHFGQFLFDKIFNFVNTHKQVRLNSDMKLVSSKATNPEDVIKFPCHSFFIEQYLDTLILPKYQSDSEGNCLCINLPNDGIMLLLELIYTSNLRMLSNEKGEAEILGNPDVLPSLLYNLFEIEQLLYDHKKESNDNLLMLIAFLKEHINGIIDFGRMSKEYEQSLLMKSLSESCNSVMNSIMQSTVKNNLNNLQRQSSFGDMGLNPNEGNVDREDDGEEGGYDNRTQNYFEKFDDKKGTQLGIGTWTDASTAIEINISEYLKYKTNLEYKYQFYSNIAKVKSSLTQQSIDYVRSNINDSLMFRIAKETNSDELKINKIILSFKSMYFDHLLKLEDKALKSQMFNLNENNISFTKQCVESIYKFLNSETFVINYADIFEMLDMSAYFMIDNLTALLEIELEEIITFENVNCLLEVAKDFSLNFLRKSCLIFLMLNFTEVKNRGMLKTLKDEDKVDLKRVMQLNNRSF